jgi:hypothetical protein
MGVHNSLKPMFSDEITTVDNREFIHPKMSDLSKRLLTYILLTISEESTTRKRNKELWETVLSIEGIMNEVESQPTESPPPYLAGFNCKNSQTAEKIFTNLQGNGYPVTTWPDLPPEVIADQRKHNIALEMRQTRFFLPVHSSLSFS